MPYKDKEQQKLAQGKANKKYQQSHKEKRYEWSRKSRNKVRGMALWYYGGGEQKCVTCGETRLECLSIDHINGGGCAHKRDLGLTGGTSFYRWLRVNNYPEGYQTLCMNCQFIKKKKECRDGVHKGSIIPS